MVDLMLIFRIFQFFIGFTWKWGLFDQKSSKYVFCGKSHFRKKKKTRARSLVTVFRSGEAPYMVPFSNLTHCQIKNYFYKFQFQIHEFSYILPYFPCLGSIAGVIRLATNLPRSNDRFEVLVSDLHPANTERAESDKAGSALDRCRIGTG